MHYKNEKNSRVACIAGKRRPKNVGLRELSHSIFRAGARNKAHPPGNVAKRPFRRLAIRLAARPVDRRAPVGLAGTRTGSLRLSGRCRHNLPFYGERRCAMKSHTIEFTRDDLVVRITRYPSGEPGKSPSVEIEVESSGLPRSFVWFDREPQLFAFKEMLEEYIETFRSTKDETAR